MGCRKRSSCKHGGYNLKISLSPQPLLVQEELLNADVLYPVVILPGLDIIFYDDYLSERVVYAAQGVRFLCAFFRVVYGQCGLYVKALVTPVRHKIHLKVIAPAFAGLVLGILFHDPDVNVKTADFQLVENDVLHYVILFLLAEIQAGIPQADIHKVVFQGRADVLFSLYVIADRTVYQKGILEIIQVQAYRVCGYRPVLYAGKGI